LFIRHTIPSISYSLPNLQTLTFSNQTREPFPKSCLSIDVTPCHLITSMYPSLFCIRLISQEHTSAIITTWRALMHAISPPLITSSASNSGSSNRCSGSVNSGAGDKDHLTDRWSLLVPFHMIHKKDPIAHPYTSFIDTLIFNGTAS
jgi:hypothetical protein